MSAPFWAQAIDQNKQLSDQLAKLKRSEYVHRYYEISLAWSSLSNLSTLQDGYVIINHTNKPKKN